MASKYTSQDGNIADASTWGGTLPGSGDTGYIDHVCTASGSVSIFSVNVRNGSLAISQNFSLTGRLCGPLTISAGTISVSSTLMYAEISGSAVVTCGGLYDTTIKDTATLNVTTSIDALAGASGNGGSAASSGGAGGDGPDGSNGSATHTLRVISGTPTINVTNNLIGGNGGAGGDGGAGYSDMYDPDGEGEQEPYPVGYSGGRGGDGAVGLAAIDCNNCACTVTAGGMASGTSGNGGNGAAGASVDYGTTIGYGGNGGNGAAGSPAIINADNATVTLQSYSNGTAGSDGVGGDPYGGTGGYGGSAPSPASVGHLNIMLTAPANTTIIAVLSAEIFGSLGASSVSASGLVVPCHGSVDGPQNFTVTLPETLEADEFFTSSGRSSGLNFDFRNRSCDCYGRIFLDLGTGSDATQSNVAAEINLKSGGQILVDNPYSLSIPTINDATSSAVYPTEAQVSTACANFGPNGNDYHGALDVSTLQEKTLSVLLSALDAAKIKQGYTINATTPGNSVIGTYAPSGTGVGSTVFIFGLGMG